MNAKDQAALNAVVAELKAEFTEALKMALQPLVEEINALQQRTANFATRVNADRKILIGEIDRLRLLVENNKPVTRTTTTARVSGSEWDVGMAILRDRHPGTRFFNCEDVLEAARSAKAAPTPAPTAAPAPVEEEEYTL